MKTIIKIKIILTQFKQYKINAISKNFCKHRVIIIQISTNINKNKIYNYNLNGINLRMNLTKRMIIIIILLRKTIIKKKGLRAN